MVSSSAVYHAGSPPSTRRPTPAQEHRPKALVIFAIVIAVLLWASAFPAIQVSLTAYTPAEVAFLRYIVASVILGVYALFRRMPLPRPRDLPLISVCGFIGFTVYNFMLNAGQMTVSAGMASFVISSEVGVIALLAWLFLGEQLGKVGWLGIALCIAGVGIISLNGRGGLQISTGVLLVFLATLSISLYSVLQKPLLQRYTAIQFTAYAIWAGTLFLFLLAPRAVGAIVHAPIGPTLAVIYMGIFPGVVAYGAWSYVLSMIPASRAGSYLALVPVAALIIAWLWLREIPTPIALVGGVIVLCGVTLVNRRTQSSR
ncbi:MAG: DMT family transporter [Cyanobacteria bacterium J06639_14]